MQSTRARLQQPHAAAALAARALAFHGAKVPQNGAITQVSQAIYLLGASVRAAAQSARRGGLDPVAMDCFGDADLANCCAAHRVDPYPQGFLPLLAQQPRGRWLYTGGLENHPELVEQLARLMPLAGNQEAVLRRVRDPWQFAQVLRQAGYAVPELQSLDESPASGEWLIKRRYSSAGLHVLPASPAAQQRADQESGWYRQQFIRGWDYSAVLLATRGDAQLLGITRQWIGEARLGGGGFRYCGSLGPAHLPRASRTLRRLAKLLASHFQLEGLFGVDFVWDGRIVWPLEINPRYTASCEILEWARGRSLIADHLAACEGKPLKPTTEYRHRGKRGKAILFARRPLRITRQTVQAAWRANGERSWPAVADIPHAGQQIDSGHPILTLLATGRTIDHLRRRLLRQARHWQAILGDQPGG